LPYFYHATIRLDGFLWYHTTSLPTSDAYVSIPTMVFHNYGFILALAGFDVDPDVGYVSVSGVTKYKNPIELYRRYGVYAYPLLVIKALVKQEVMSSTSEGYIDVKGPRRVTYPIYTKVVKLTPGSFLTTLIISEEKLPERFTVSIGSKRHGTMLIKPVPIKVTTVSNAYVLNPFNDADVVDVSNYTVLMNHAAGNIGIYGVASKAYMYTHKVLERERTFIYPALRDI